MPTVNRRFLLLLFVLFATGTGLLVCAHTIQSQRIPDALRRQADRATAEGSRDQTIRYLRQYLEFRPSDLDARIELADNLKARGTTGELSYLYDAILRTDPLRMGIRRDAVALALKTGRFTDAADHAEKLLEANPEDGLAWLQRADALATLHRMDEAIKAYESACRFAKDDPRAYRDYLFWTWTEGAKPSEALAVADRFTKAFPQLAEPFVTRAKMKMAENESAHPAIKSDLDRALAIADEVAGQSADAGLLFSLGVAERVRAEVLDHYGRPEEADTWLQRSIAALEQGGLHLQAAWSRTRWGLLLRQRGAQAEAEKLFHEAEARFKEAGCEFPLAELKRLLGR